MSGPSLPQPAALPGIVAAHDSFTLESVVDTLFERSAALHALALPFFFESSEKQALTSSDVYERLIGHVHAALTRLLDQSATSAQDKATLDSILAAHPRLGESKVESAQSKAEQAQLSGVAEKLAQLNRDYEQAFPGLRYVVFVNGRGRDVIIKDMEARIAQGDAHAERVAAIQAMCDIALDRASKLLA